MYKNLSGQPLAGQMSATSAISASPAELTGPDPAGLALPGSAPHDAGRRRLLQAMGAAPLLGSSLAGPRAWAAAGPLKVGFVYVSPVGSAGWSYQHDLGRLDMERRLGAAVKTTAVENVAEGPDSERVMRDLAASGHQLIFATSFGYLEPA
ncbi:MAG: hypothetical protein RL722_942, partial [Pseudomonadota bacterium]